MLLCTAMFLPGPQNPGSLRELYDSAPGTRERRVLDRIALQPAAQVCDNAASAERLLEDANAVIADTGRTLDRAVRAVELLPLIEAHWRSVVTPPLTVGLFLALFFLPGLVSRLDPVTLFRYCAACAVYYIAGVAVYSAHAATAAPPADADAVSSDVALRSYCAAVEREAARVQDPGTRRAQQEGPWRMAFGALVAGGACAVAAGSGVAFAKCLALYAGTVYTIGALVSAGVPRRMPPGGDAWEREVCRVGRSPHVDVCLGAGLGLGLGLGAPELVRRDDLGALLETLLWASETGAANRTAMMTSLRPKIGTVAGAALVAGKVQAAEDAKGKAVAVVDGLLTAAANDAVRQQVSSAAGWALGKVGKVGGALKAAPGAPRAALEAPDQTPDPTPDDDGAAPSADIYPDPEPDPTAGPQTVDEAAVPGAADDATPGPGAASDAAAGPPASEPPPPPLPPRPVSPGGEVAQQVLQGVGSLGKGVLQTWAQQDPETKQRIATEAIQTGQQAIGALSGLFKKM